MREPHQVQGQQELHLLRQEGRSDLDTKEETDVRDEYKDMVGTGAALTGWVTLLSLVMCAALLVSLVFTRRFASGAFMVVGAFIVCVLMLVARMAIGELFW